MTFPKHLSRIGKQWAEGICKKYEIEGEPHLEKILITATECLDRINECRKRIKKDGAFFSDRFGSPKAHPALLEERNHRVAFCRLVRELNLTDAPEDSRPHGLKYEAD